MKFAIITCSDTRSLEEDEAGNALVDMIEAKDWCVVYHNIVSDERPVIAAEILKCCEDMDADFVLTCGGSGLSPRDVTPEATKDVCDRDVPGIAEAMRARSLEITDNAMLSRSVCMQRGTSIVINLPGSTKGATENLSFVIDTLPHALKMANGGGH